MNGREEDKLKAADIYRLLDQLHVYMGSAHAAIVPVKTAPDVSGNIISFDGRLFLLGFAKYLDDFGHDKNRALADVAKVMELSIYVRNGGVKAIRYRLETGGMTLSQDCFDALAKQLCLKEEADEYAPILDEQNTNLLSRIRDVDLEEEAKVSAAISEIDQLLLELNKRVENISEEQLASEVGEQIKAAEEGDSDSRAGAQ